MLINIDTQWFSSTYYYNKGLNQLWFSFSWNDDFWIIAFCYWEQGSYIFEWQTPALEYEMLPVDCLIHYVDAVEEIGCTSAGKGPICHNDAVLVVYPLRCQSIYDHIMSGDISYPNMPSLCCPSSLPTQMSINMII